MEKQRGSAEVSDSSTTSQQQQVQQQAALNPQQQALNSYNEMRSAILQNSHHPSGNAVDQYDHPQQHQLQQQHSSNTAVQQQQQQPSHHSLLNNNPSNGGSSQNSHTAIINNNNGHGSNSQMMPPQMRAGGSNTDVAQMRSSSKHSVAGAPGSGTTITAQNHLQQLYAAPNYATVTPSENAIAAQNHMQQIYASPNYAAATPSENAVNLKAHASNGHVPSQQQLMAGGGGGGASNNIGKIADYDPLTDGPRPVPTAGRSSTTLVYSSEPRGGIAGGNSVYPKRIGSISDIDPANGIYGSLTSAEQAHQQKQQQYYQQVQMMQQQEHPPQQQQQQQQMRQQPSYVSLQDKQSRQSTALRVYRAIYDYEAQDVDEVSFREGDVIFEVESIDSGWMTGRVERTGKTGMLPANYVEQAVI
ncbi:LIM and SH3 domain protein Lasp isoform X4 [Drosophila bipectinata]